MATDGQLADLEAAVHYLAAIDRPSASEGEREAAEWIAQRLRELGCEQVVVEEERAHGTYWWPLGLLTALSALGGQAAVRGRRLLGFLTGAFAAAGIAGDVGGGSLWFRRRFLPHRSTWNVVAETGDADARHTVVVVAHHDAAHSGLMFHPAIPRFAGRHFRGLIERSDTTPAVMFPVFGGPLLVALGSLLSRALLRVGVTLSAGSAAMFVEIGARSAVPGANDNLTGVATLVGVARALQAQPVEGVRVVLVSTGSEESFMEGMQAFGRRHFARFSPAHTHFICVDTVGSPELIELECEGMLMMRDYPEDFKALVSDCAEEAGVHLRRGLRFRNATDGLISLRAGYPTVMLGSVNELKLPDNYHWRTDTADNVEYESVADAVKLCVAVIRRLAGQPFPAPA
jgi:peptidase M28-like protein